MKDALIATAKGYCLMECMDFVKIVGRGGWMKNDCPRCHSENVVREGYFGVCKTCGKNWLVKE